MDKRKLSDSEVSQPEAKRKSQSLRDISSENRENESYLEQKQSI